MTHTNIIIKLLQLEADGNSEEAMNYLSDNYKMTWMYKTKSKTFPQVRVDKDFKNKMEEVYSYTEREYKIYSILENDNIVTAEIVESYFDKSKNKKHVTPIAFVWTFDKDGKVETGKHYCDPDISYESLEDYDFDALYGYKSKFIIKSVD